MSRPVFAANWKMNHGPTDARAFLRILPRSTIRATPIARSSSFRPAIALSAVVDALEGSHAMCALACRTSTGKTRARSPARSRRRWRATPVRITRSSDIRSVDTCSARPTRRRRRKVRGMFPCRTRSDPVRRREARASANEARPTPSCCASCALDSRGIAPGADRALARRVRTGVGDRHRKNRDARGRLARASP